MKDFTDYIKEVNQLYQAGNATEHSYRHVLLSLIKTILSESSSLQIVNEPRRIDCGAPDYIITRANIPVCYIEAKDIGIDLNSKQNKSQFDRYINSLDNLIITDYLTFIFYQKQQRVDTIQIAEIRNDKITSIKENFTKFENFINAFAHAEPQSITKSQKLSQLMASKAKLMAEVIEMILNDTNNQSSFHQEKSAFQKILIKNISNHDFADVYAQTITYGMFAARLQDAMTNKFDRIEAAKLIPKTNPFLRKLFQNIAVFDLDTRFCWIVDDLAESFRVTDMNAVMGELGDKDPIIHFYECFLSEYNPTLRKNRGVYYTPNEVVNFIVRAVDDILINDFELPMGLASVEPISDWQKNNINIQSEIVCSATDKHRVQILDPATGTGTFLVETIKHIHHKFSSQQGLWQSYVSDHLLPRLNGFEILMAPYTMAHLNLNWTLEKTGFINENEKRLRVFLTNSLDEFSEGHRGQDRLFSQEADEAGAIKLDTPVMVVLGNPPYNVESQTSNEWIDRLLQDYKKEPTGEKLNEKNPKSINDDYVKFIRFGQHFIEKKGEGVLAFITNNSFLDNPTFRGMRWNLLNSFNKVYIIDLHGSSIKKEIAPDSSKDENVFNIMQGVSINIFVKKSNKDILVDEKKHAEIYHYDLYGKREDKFTFLQSNKLYNVPFKKLRPVEPYYFFTSKVFSGKSRYEKGFSIQDMFLINSVGVSTARDDFTIHFTAFSLTQTIKDFVKLDIESARNKYRLGKDTRDWSVAGAHKELTSNPDFTKLVEICYRPFDKRFTYYTGKSKGFHCTPRGEVMRHFVNSETIRSEKEFVDYIGKSRGFHSRPRNEVMRHFLNGPNVGLVTERIIANKETPYSDVFIINKITDKHILGSAAYVFPLYLKPEKENEFAQPNMNMAIVQKIAKSIELPTVNTKQFFSYTISDENNELTPINIFDYIYARLHSQSYREKYKEFLKIDFPKIPYPENADEFWHYVSAGRRLRKLHLMDGVEPDNQIANFNVSGTNVIDKPKYINIDDEIGKVYINDTQHFDNVPLVAWEFYIGGYQPAQKWLKDRKGKTLSYDDIIHYQKIVKVLYATYGEMKKIDYQNLTQNIFPKLI